MDNFYCIVLLAFSMNMFCVIMVFHIRIDLYTSKDEGILDCVMSACRARVVDTMVHNWPEYMDYTN